MARSTPRRAEALSPGARPRTASRWAFYLALAVLVVSALPPVVAALQARMTTQMLVQIPILVAAGYALRGGLRPAWRRALDAWNGCGVPGVLIAAFVMAYWMLPRSMDAAVIDPRMTAARIVTLPLLVGLPLGMSWPRTNFVFRGLLASEGIAMCFRFGWLYLVSPMQLCSQYMLGDQQHTGAGLIVLGAALTAWVAFRLLFGHFEESSASGERAGNAGKTLPRRAPVAARATARRTDRPAPALIRGTPLASPRP